MSKQTEDNKKQRAADLAVCAVAWPEAKLGRSSNADLTWLAEIAKLVDETIGTVPMTATLNRYKAGYEPHLTPSGKKSLSNGDAIAHLLSFLDPEEAVEICEEYLGFEIGELAAKYAHLNPGQRRMNAGNRLRAAVKRGDVTIETQH